MVIGARDGINFSLNVLIFKKHGKQKIIVLAPLVTEIEIAMYNGPAILTN